MKYIKLFEELNLENVRRYPHLFNIFIDPRYIKEEDYERVNELLKEYKYDLKTPFFINDTFYDTRDDVYFHDILNGQLPENLELEGDFILEGADNLTLLPNGLKVGGGLYLQDSNIKELPEGLEIGGDLDLQGSKNIESLPENLKVGGKLIISDTNIKEIPNSATIKGNIIE